MATPHLLAFIPSPPPPHIENYIKQHVKAASWCRAVLLSWSCSKLYTLHSENTSLPVFVCCPLITMDWMVT